MKTNQHVKRSTYNMTDLLRKNTRYNKELKLQSKYTNFTEQLLDLQTYIKYVTLRNNNKVVINYKDHMSFRRKVQEYAADMQFYENIAFLDEAVIFASMYDEVFKLLEHDKLTNKHWNSIILRFKQINNKFIQAGGDHSIVFPINDADDKNHVYYAVNISHDQRTNIELLMKKIQSKRNFSTNDAKQEILNAMQSQILSIYRTCCNFIKTKMHDFHTYDASYRSVTPQPQSNNPVILKEPIFKSKTPPPCYTSKAIHVEKEEKIEQLPHIQFKNDENHVQADVHEEIVYNSDTPDNCRLHNGNSLTLAYNSSNSPGYRCRFVLLPDSSNSPPVALSQINNNSFTAASTKAIDHKYLQNVRDIPEKSQNQDSCSEYFYQLLCCTCEKYGNNEVENYISKNINANFNNKELNKP